MIKDLTYLDKDFKILNSNEKISKALPLLGDKDAIMVVENDEYQGVLLKKDIMIPKIPTNGKVKTYMRQVPKMDIHEPEDEIIRLMFENGLYLLPVVENNKPIGIITADKLLQELVSKIFGNKPIKNYMTSDVITIDHKDKIAKAIDIFRKQNISRLPVVKNKKIIGIITMDDIIEKVYHPENKPKGWGKHGAVVPEKKKYLDLSVTSVMTEEPMIMLPDSKIKNVIEKMLKYGLRGMLICTEDELQGIVTKKDLLETIITLGEKENINIQFAGELGRINDFNKKEGSEILLNKLEKYKKFLNTSHLLVYLKQYDETKKGEHLIYSKMRLYSSNGMFIASDTGWGLFNALKNSVSKLERQIKKSKKEVQHAAKNF